MSVNPKPDQSQKVNTLLAKKQAELLAHNAKQAQTQLLRIQLLFAQKPVR